MQRQMFRTLYRVYFASIVALGSFTGCSRKTNMAVPTAAAVVIAARGQLASRLTVAGQFQPYQEVDLHAKVSGYIRSISVDIGDRVKRGQVLAVLEVPELDAQLLGTQSVVKQSQSQIARAQEEIKRDESTHTALHAAYKRLEQASKARPGLIAEQELDDALARDQASEAQIAAAKSALDAAIQQLGVSEADRTRVKTLAGYSSITAPFNGVVTMRYADTGSLIQAGTSSDTQSMPVVRVAQSDLLRLRMPVPEADVPYIHQGDEVRIRVDATGQIFTGKVVRFTRSLDTATRTMLTEVDVPNPSLSLSPGMYAETTIPLQQRSDVVILPAQAVVQNGSHAHVLVVNAQDKVERRNVSIGVQGADQIEIASGLQAGERVIESGQSNYQAGEIIRPKITIPFTWKDPDGQDSNAQGGEN